MFTPHKIIKVLVSSGFALVCSAIPVHAISFNFSYTNQDPNVIGQTRNSISDTTVITASGTLDINRLAGETFSNTDISNVNITVTDGTNSFTFNKWSTAGGVIAADGLSASFDAAGNPAFFDFSPGAFTFFGCSNTGCIDGSNSTNILVNFINSDPSYELNYLTQQSALAAFKFTALTPVPFEFNPALGIGVLGTVFVIKKKLIKKAK